MVVTTLNNIKMMICTAMGLFGTFIAELFGGWSSDMTTLLIFMIVDFIMGISIAVVFGKSPKTENGALDSNSCFRGLCKKCAILLFVLVAYRLDVSLGVNYIKTAAVIGFITNEAISVLENAAIMGLPMPSAVKNAIELLKKEKSDA